MKLQRKETMSQFFEMSKNQNNWSSPIETYVDDLDASVMGDPCVHNQVVKGAHHPNRGSKNGKYQRHTKKSR